MKAIWRFAPLSRAAVVLPLLAMALSVEGQTYLVTNWVNDPFCVNTNYALSGAASVNPSFRNNGVISGSLYIDSPIGATLALAHAGDRVTFSGQVTLAGRVNPDGNMQFRFGLLFRGKNKADTNWLGYLAGNPTGVGGGAPTGLYVRSNPNMGNYAGGFPPDATRPHCDAHSYAPGWSEGTYVFSLSVTRLSPAAQEVSWKIAGVAPNRYSYSGVYTNTSKLTMPPAFDQVGFLGGAALFNTATDSNVIIFKSLLVNYAPRENRNASTKD